MRLWLDPARLAQRGLTATDVLGALHEQNVQVAAGQVGQPPANRTRTIRSACAQLDGLSSRQNSKILF